MAGDLYPSSTHPPLPPTTEEIRISHLRLLRSRRVGTTTYHRLLTEHGTAQNALAALPDVARAAGAKGYEVCPEHMVQKELKAGARLGAHLLIHGFSGYPASLTDMENPPPLLWAMGDISLGQRPMVAMVGARNASALGTRMARALAKDLGEAGFVVVSGLARGIDTAAHAGSLETGTIAVQAGGVDTVYPAENAELSDKILQKGLRLSEQPIGMQPMARHFPARNRIVAGLASACIVVEAAARSGSLITARDAADIGRDVMAVPGHPFDARASGCNMLIRDGATLVRRAEDVLEALGPIAHPAVQKLAEGDPVRPVQGGFDLAPAPEHSGEKPTRQHAANANAPRPQTRALHQQILDRLGPTPLPEDQLLRDLSGHSSDVAPALTELELEGEITRHSGGLLSRSN